MAGIRFGPELRGDRVVTGQAGGVPTARGRNHVRITTELRGQGRRTTDLLRTLACGAGRGGAARAARSKPALSHYGREESESAASERIT